ncbi:MAG: hypothetical protein GYA62_07725 [Bacteroidales bacterium]|nr:hypothetical protein [Bacteroidales bacterium]
MSIIFTDSIETFFNNDSSIVKSTTYSKFNKRPSTRLEYFRKNKEDSISKHFLGDTLRCIYETRFDSSDRIVYYALKNYYPDSSSGFEWNYEYRDSLLNTGKVLIQTIFVTDDFNVRQFHFRVLSIYDGKNRKIKEIRESKTNDPWAQITTYIYNDKDSVVEERVFTAGIENVFSNQKSPKNTKCWQEN